MEPYRVNIAGLSHKIHQFEYEIGEGFFDRYGKNLISSGTFSVKVSIDKRETFLNVEFDIKGIARLICDRSLDPFDFPVEEKNKVVFKFGEEDQEISDEIVIIHRDTVSLELGQYIYEFICLAIPMKKLHPRYQDEDTDDEGGIIYTSSPEENDDKDSPKNGTDPRWDILKKLK